jgi:hypothetical protein
MVLVVFLVVSSGKRAGDWKNKLGGCLKENKMVR